VNVLFGGLSLAGFVQCLTFDGGLTEGFFHSDFYLAFVFVDAGKNLLFGVFMFATGYSKLAVVSGLLIESSPW
jgi:hypothetical protein